MHHPYNPHHHSGVSFVRVFFLVVILTVTLLAVYASIHLPDKTSLIPKPSPTPAVQSSFTPPQNTPKVDTQVQVSGPGGCSSLEGCLKYCDSHPADCASKK